MPIQKVAALDAEPDIVLIRWRVLQMSQSHRHLVGTRADNFDGRVSTAILSLDVSRQVAVRSKERSCVIAVWKGAEIMTADELIDFTQRYRTASFCGIFAVAMQGDQ